MGKTLVTGGTGFLGSHLVRALAERGDDLRLLIRTDTSDDHLADIEFERVNGQVTDTRAVRRAVKGVDRVFHVAGRTSLHRRHAEAVFEANVGGTKLIMQEAAEAGVKRVVHTSSVVALGPAAPRTASDETQVFSAGGLDIPYMNSKHEAEAEALRIAAGGLPTVIVSPSFVIGPNDPKGTSMRLIRRFLLRQIPAYVDGGLNIVDVRDVAAGQLLADELGESGERYILGGRNFTLQRLFADLERISGVPAPPVRVPADLAHAGISLANRVGIQTAVSTDEISSARLWWTFKNNKAKRELGFAPRPHEQTLRDAIEWQAAELGDRVGGDNGWGDRALDVVGRVARLGSQAAGWVR